MALTLSSELLAAQTAQSRHPIIEVIAGRLQADYPFTGNAIANADATSQGVSSALFLSDGRLAVAFAGGSGGRYLKFIITGSSVAQFSSEVTFDSDVSLQATDIDTTIVGVNIGVAVQWGSSAISLYIVSPEGVAASETKLTGLSTLHGVTVAQTATGWAMVYAQEIGGVYSLNIRTTTDFIIWSDASMISISGLDSSYQLKDPCLRRLADGSFLLAYAYADSGGATPIFNIHASTSTDLATWDADSAITSTTEISQDYVTPSIGQKSDGSLFIASEFDESYLTMETSDSGWDSAYDIAPSNVWIDEAAGKLYLSSMYPGAGYKMFQGSCRIDLETWNIDAFYDLSTIPAVPPIFGTSTSCLHVDQNGIGDGIVSIHADSYEAAAAIDYINDSITTYYFKDYSTQFAGATKNVNHDLDEYWGDYWYLYATAVHDGKMWFGFHWGAVSEEYRAILGYIDLTQQTAPFDFVTVNKSGGGDERVAQAGARFFFYPDAGFALVASEDLVDAYTAPLHVLSLSEDTCLKCYHFDAYADFPFNGVSNACLIGDYIYAVPTWVSTRTADAHKWGLLRINLLNDKMDYFYPPWVASSGNYLYDISVNETATELYFRTTNGVAVFNYTSETWEQLENTVSTGLPPTDTDAYSYAGGIAYDKTRACFVYGDQGQVYLVPRDGSISSIAYQAGDDLGSLSAPQTLASGYDNKSPSIAIDSSDIVYATWTDVGDDPTSVRWDKSSARLDIASLLTGETTLEWSIDSPGKITCTLAMGHLFDPYNQSSLLAPYLAKGKGLSVRIGERISGVDHWADQGVFTITRASMRHKIKEYPTISITAQDVRYLWGLHQVAAIDVDAQIPEDALVDIITENTPIIAENITVPSFPLSFTFDAQWLAQTLGDAIDDVAHRFQHFPMIDMLGNVDFRPITFSGESVLTVGKEAVISFSPNDESSDLTNLITVTGEGLDDFEQVYEEEQITTLSGTVGWWGYKNDFHIDYSEDKSATYKDPRLEVKESATGIMFKLAGEIDEGITEIDPENKYCVVTVTAPNLVPILVAAIALYAAGNLVGDLTMAVGGGYTIPVGRKMEGVGLLLAMTVLGSTGNFQYALHGRPVGYVKRSYQASADDSVLQQELGYVIENEIEGFLCHNPAHCQTVADFEMAVSVAERNKATVEMTTNLKTEVGDPVTVEHPYTNALIKMFVTGLKRSYQVSTSDGDDGHLIDTVEGWVL